MSLHHNSINSTKINIKQIEIIKNNTTIVYVLMNILRDKWNMSALFLRLDENFFERSTRVHHVAFDDDDEDDENDDDEKKIDENNENDDVENDETQTTRREQSEKRFEENKDDLEKKTFDVSFDSESSRDQSDVDVKSKKSEKNVDEKNADEKKTSSSNSFNSFSSFSEFFNFDEKEIASFTTSFQRRVASKSCSTRNRFSIFDEIFDDRRKRRSKKKTIDF